ncbi:MAG: Coenzyme F420 hydrogenase/dehydrogenase, beta subunit C-terminal domain [Deltaproteobacteria bacterium]
MKTFANLIEEVQKPGLCHRCGGCVTFCTAINYGALELDAEGKPRYADEAKCIECGLCHTICPEIDELDAETRKSAGWVPPIGRVIETGIARATDTGIRQKATDGGVVTALLVHLFKRGRIDGAIVSKPAGAFQRLPFLAESEKDILQAAGFFFDTSQGMTSFSDYYLTFSQIREFDPLIKKGLQRVAFVGTPCQIKAVRRMQSLGIIPSDSIKFCLGLFCSGNFVFGKKEQEKLAQIGGFKFKNVKKINIKEELIVRLYSGEEKSIMLDELEFMKRFACYFCPDYSAEYADVSFGGIGADDGWTTVVTRTPVGRAIFADAKANTIEEHRPDDIPKLAARVRKKVQAWSARKKEAAAQNRKVLDRKFPGIKRET